MSVSQSISQSSVDRSLTFSLPLLSDSASGTIVASQKQQQATSWCSSLSNEPPMPTRLGRQGRRREPWFPLASSRTASMPPHRHSADGAVKMSTNVHTMFNTQPNDFCSLNLLCSSQTSRLITTNFGELVLWGCYPMSEVDQAISCCKCD